jgi:hypothetical protein
LNEVFVAYEARQVESRIVAAKGYVYVVGECSVGNGEGYFVKAE